LRAALAELESETRRSVPDEGALSATRLKLTRISGRRRALIDCKIGPTLHDVSVEDLRRLGALRRAAAEMAALSSQHIGRWTMRAILADWDGYRRESNVMRNTMLQRIDEESAIIYPLLTARRDQFGERAAAPTTSIRSANIWPA
jgi:hypothetical protein